MWNGHKMQQSDLRSAHRKSLGVTSNIFKLFLNWRHFTH